ncbi:MAG TPA: hypothetical protein VGI78_19110 [Acetobacteraceae bacterium]
MQPYPATFTYQLQRDATLLDAIVDWHASAGAARGRNRRYAMRLLAAERARRNWRRAELLAAARRSLSMLKAAA